LGIFLNFQDPKFSFKLTLCLIVAAACFSSSIIAAALPSIAKYYKLSAHETSLLVGLYLFGYFLGQIFYGIFASIKNTKSALLFGFKIFILGALIQIASILSHSIALLFCGRFITAFGASAGLVGSFTLIQENFSTIKAQKMIALAFTSLISFNYFAMAIGGFITDYLGFEFLFYITLCIAICYFHLVKNNIPLQHKIKRHSLKKDINHYLEALQNPKLILAAIIVAFTTSFAYLYSATVPVIAAEYFNLAPKHFGSYSILNFLGLILGGYLATQLLKNLRPLTVILVGLIIIALPLLLLTLGADLIFKQGQDFNLFFISTSCVNIGLGIIYTPASFIALNAIVSGATSSSIMNCIKMAIPSLALIITSQINLSSKGRFILPITTLFIIITLCWSGLVLQGRRAKH
jgi:MFS transporter, DHA1 family, multidrug resistance protein